MCKCTLPGHEVHPLSQSKSQFLGQFLLSGLDLEVYLDGLWGRRLKKGRQLFYQKSAPPDKILATPMSSCGTVYSNGGDGVCISPDENAVVFSFFGLVF